MTHPLIILQPTKQSIFRHTYTQTHCAVVNATIYFTFEETQVSCLQAHGMARKPVPCGAFQVCQPNKLHDQRTH